MRYWNIFYLTAILVLALLPSQQARAVQTADIVAADSVRLQLTMEELAWLKAHPVIRVGGSSQFEPAFILNADGTHSGIYPDLYDLMGNAPRCALRDS